MFIHFGDRRLDLCVIARRVDKKNTLEFDLLKKACLQVEISIRNVLFYLKLSDFQIDV